MRQDPGEAARADLARAEVLVAIRPRPAVRARVVEVDQAQPPEADRAVELGHQPVDGGGIVHRVARAPEMGDVEAPREPLRGRRPRRRSTASIRASSSTLEPMPEPAARPVLEDQRDAGRRHADVREHPAQAVRQPPDARLEARAAMRPQVDVDDPGVPRRGDPQLVGQDRDGALEDVGIRPGEVDEVRGMDDEGSDPGGRPADRGRRAAPGAASVVVATRSGCR